VLHNIFEKGLMEVHFNEEMEREKELMVDSSFCFRKDKVPEKVFVSLDLLWKIVTDEVEARRDIKEKKESDKPQRPES
jgi:hypothetical protein